MLVAMVGGRQVGSVIVSVYQARQAGRQGGNTGRQSAGRHYNVYVKGGRQADMVRTQVGSRLVGSILVCR